MRRQLAAYSPLSAAPLLRAALTNARQGELAKQQLRTLLAREYGADEVVLCGTGTQALQFAIKATAAALGEAKPLVALPAFTCYDVATAAAGAGLPLSLYDVDPLTLAPDLDTLETTLRAGARIVVVTPLYGIPVPWDEIADLATRYGAVLIEDAAQGHGATWRGKPLGSFGPMSVLSFGRGKGWTGGRGGAVLFRRGHGLAALPSNGALGQASGTGSVLFGTTAQWLLGRPAVYGLPASLPWLGLGETRYHEPVAPADLPAAAALVLLATREAADREAQARRAAGRWCLDQLRHPGVQGVKWSAEGEPGFLRFPMRMRGGYVVLRTSVPAHRLGIAPSYPRTLATLEPVQHLLQPGSRTQFPGAETLAADLFTLPTHSLASQEERERAVRLVRTWAASAFAAAKAARISAS